MLQALVHLGLSALLVIAPALCCCNIRLLAGQIGSLPAQQAPCPACPQHAPEPVPSCCHAKKSAQKASCCQESQQPSSDSQPKPAKPNPSRCDYCGERLEATAPESAPSVRSPEPTGELISLAFLGIAAVAPEHLGLLGGLEPPERAGVDTRYMTLYEHHVLRC